jgi:conjugative transposon TraJ protein
MFLQIASEIHGLQAVLDNIYNQMLPLCSGLIGVGRGIAAFASLFYIAYRVWRHIANAEPVDLFPLFRPFVIGFAILVFPEVISLINGILQPCVDATAGMVNDSNIAISKLLAQKQQAIENSDFWKMYVGPEGEGDQARWYKYTHPDDPTGANEGILEHLGNDIKFQIARTEWALKNEIKEWLSEVLEVLYEAAALCINTIRTFYMLVLAILGPLVFGLSVFDGMHHTLTVWLARYINIFLWLPVANLFGSILGKIQENMIQLDINQIQASGDTYFSSTDAGYLIFLVIGIIGYFTVPSVANYIVSAGGGNTLLYKVSGFFSSSSKTIVSTTGAGISTISNAISSGASYIGERFTKNNSESSSSQNSFQEKKISGDV